MAARTALTILATLGGVTATQIASGAVTNAKLGADAVTTDKIQAGAIATSDIAADAVDSTKIGAGAIAPSDLDLTATFNFTGTLQKDGVAIVGGDLMYCAVRAVQSTNVANLATGAPNPVAGVTPDANDDILVMGQTTGSQNGIYNVDTVGTGSNGAWTRAAERNASAELPIGMLVYDKATEKLYKLTAFGGTLGTDSLTFEEHQEGLTVANSGETAVLGTGNGSNLNFDMGQVATVVGAVVFIDGVQQDNTIWSIAAGAGAGGVDQLQFSAGNAPPNGTSVEILAFIRA